MPYRNTFRIAAATCVAATLAACTPVVSTTASPAVGDANTTTLLTRLGTDTLAIEQYTRTASRIDGVIASRTPFSILSRYTVMLGAGNAPTSAEYSFTKGDGSPVVGAVQPISFRYSADSVTLTGHRASGDSARRIAARPMLVPWIGSSFGLFELAFARLMAEGRDSATFAMLPMSFGARSYTNFGVRLSSGDSASIDWFGSPMRVHHDGRGSIMGIDGRETTDKVRVDRVASIDVPALARVWSARDAVVGAMGATSTRDTARATIGSAHVWVDYGRPSLRGRNVWVNGVLGDTIWRTGANAATQLKTDTDLLIGGQHVPAGTYSLWTWAGQNGYHLIVNRQSGQWGTDYDVTRDLIRVPLRETDGAPRTERFTITLEPQGTGAAALVMAWGTRRLSVPITAQ